MKFRELEVDAKFTFPKSNNPNEVFIKLNTLGELFGFINARRIERNEDCCMPMGAEVIKVD